MARKSAKNYPALTDIDSASADDATIALHWYCSDYHAGQWTMEYRIMCQTGYSPGAHERGPGTHARPFYQSLKQGFIKADEMLKAIRRATRVSGYGHCTCRDCMETVMTGGGHSGLCHDCEANDCDELGAGECLRADAYAAGESE